ncbi:MAG: glycosyltransferase family 2 protein, partial [Bacteroidia bacterium]|nr:glycosyltransferase family 2 protein [Bacteroidia bacterium]
LRMLREQACDVVIGTRFKRKQDRRAIPPLRRWILRLSIVFNGLVTGVWLSDSHNGFRCMNRKAAAVMRFRQDRMAHATEVLSIIKTHRLVVREIPIHVRYFRKDSFKGLLKRMAEVVGDMLFRRRKT